MLFFADTGQITYLWSNKNSIQYQVNNKSWDFPIRQTAAAPSADVESEVGDFGWLPAVLKLVKALSFQLIHSVWCEIRDDIFVWLVSYFNLEILDSCKRCNSSTDVQHIPSIQPLVMLTYLTMANLGNEYVSDTIHLLQTLFRFL